MEVAEMNPRIAALNFITCSLGADRRPDTLEKLRFEIAAGKPDWGSVVTMANLQFVTPALWVSLGDKGLAEMLPDDLKEYLEALHSLNADRNRNLKQQVVEAAGELNGKGIEPVLLKGAAHLFTDTFGDPGARMMGDLDILIPGDRLKSCLDALQGLRYRTDENLKRRFADHHHFAPLFRPDAYAAIELHLDPVAPAAVPILPTETAWAHSRPLAVEGVRMRVLSPTHRILHNILHSEIADHNHRRGLICLRQLHDLVATATRYVAEVEWRAIEEGMDRHGRSRELQAYLYLARRLFGLDVSPGGRPAFGSIVHYLRCHLGVRWAWFARGDFLLQRFSARRICRDYGCENTLLPVSIGRARYALYLVKKYTRRPV